MPGKSQKQTPGAAEIILLARGHQHLPETPGFGVENNQGGRPKERRKWEERTRSDQEKGREGATGGAGAPPTASGSERGGDSSEEGQEKFQREGCRSHRTESPICIYFCNLFHGSSQWSWGIES